MGSGTSKSYDKPAELPAKWYPDFIAGLPSLEGRNIAVTGCTSGTGLICAKAVGEKGAHVYMLNRPSSRAEAAVGQLKEAGLTVTHVDCDLQSFESVKKAGEELSSLLEASGLDVLVNNAGVMATPDKATGDGYDNQMQTNHLSHFLLTAKVWPLLEKAVSERGEARVVNHSSEARKGPPLEEKYFRKNGGNLGGDANGMVPFTGATWDRYHQTKLANVVYTYALKDKAEAAGSKVMSLVAHPGLASTNLQVKSAEHGSMGHGFSDWFMKNMAQSGEDGAMGIIACAAKQGVKSGEFYGPAMFTGPARVLPEEKRVTPESREMLWKVSVEETGAEYPF